MVLICRQMKWTYQEYLEQPSWFIDLISMTENAEIEYQNKEIKKSQRNIKHR